LCASKFVYHEGHKEHEGKKESNLVFLACLAVDRQNKSPFAIALGDWFRFRTYFLTSNASPNDSEIVIIVIIVIGEAKFVLHIGGIIAQTNYLGRVSFAVNKTLSQLQPVYEKDLLPRSFSHGHLHRTQVQVEHTLATGASAVGEGEFFSKVSPGTRWHRP
jgi:hypothetical protein